MTPALSVQSLRKSYGRSVAVDDLCLSVEPGELACLIGPNGAGKSTTMRVIAGLQLADSGEISIGGHRVESPGHAKTLCTLTPQELALFEYLTGEETLRLVGGVRGVEPPLLEQRIEHWISVTSLAAARGKLVRQYSGGMKRKLAVACAMLAEPKVVLLDESFTGLDPESTRALQIELRAYCDRGGAVLLSSHILDMVQAITDRVIMIVDGRCVDSMTSREMSDRIPSEFKTLTDYYLAHVTKAQRANVGHG